MQFMYKHKTVWSLLCLCVCVHRQECKKLREELREEHEENKRSALTQLAQNKDQEMCSARESWQRKVEDLLEQVRNTSCNYCTNTCWDHCSHPMRVHWCCARHLYINWQIDKLTEQLIILLWIKNNIEKNPHKTKLDKTDFVMCNFEPLNFVFVLEFFSCLCHLL